MYKRQTYDGATRILYLNGVEIGRDSIAPNTLDTAAGGLIAAGGAGYLDDVRVYRHALNALEAKALAETGWLLADTAQTRAAEAATTWSASVPAGLEGFYELQTRAADALGNVADEAQEVVTWRGSVDSLAPRLLSFTATPAAGGITFALTVEDFDLALAGVTMPAACIAANTTVTPQRYQSPWYLSFVAQAATSQEAAQVASRIFRATIQCQARWAVTNDTFRVCDLANNCTEARYTGANVGTPNTLPVANAQSVSAQVGVTKAITLTGSDANNDPLTYVVVTPPAHGLLGGVAPNLTYTANPGFSGADSFAFKVNDGFGDSPAAAVTINVVAPALTATPTATATPTNTPVAPTATATATPTNTPVTPGAPTATVTATSTQTPEAPTATSTPSATPTASPTPTVPGAGSAAVFLPLISR